MLVLNQNVCNNLFSKLKWKEDKLLAKHIFFIRLYCCTKTYA